MQLLALGVVVSIDELVLAYLRPRAVSSAGRAPALQAGGRKFEPCTAHLDRSVTAARRTWPSRTGAGRYVQLTLMFFVSVWPALTRKCDDATTIE